MRYAHVTLLALLLLSTAACRGDGATQSPGILVLEAVGDVRQGGNALKSGATVTLDQSILVGAGRCTLQLPGGEELRLFADSELRPVNESNVRLVLGKLWARVAKGRATKLVIDTPNAVAGVRGTEFLVEVAAKRTRVAVLRGKVAVANRKTPKKEITVDAGRQVIVEDEAPPTEPAAFDAAPEEAAWEALETPPEPEPSEEVEPEEQGAAPAEPVPARRKSALEREGDETKRKLQEESEQTERQLKKEETKTRKGLQEEERKTRESLKKDREKAKGSVKDFLD